MMKNIFRSSAKTKLRSPIVLILLAAVVVLAATAISWFYYVQGNADRVFWGTIDNNLKTTSFTRTIKEDDGSQSTNQVIQTFTSPKQVSASKTTITYGAAESGVVVSTDNIGTPTTDYVRYSSIKTNQKSTTGHPLNFSDVLNVWGKSDPQQPGQTTGQQYNESVLSAIPFGNLGGTQRKALISQIKNTQAYNYSVVSVKHSGVLRRPTYVFRVQVKASAYIDILKSYAKATGLTQLDAVDASQYASSQPIEVDITVDGWSHQIKQVVYGGGARTEQISAYNSLRKLPALPSQTISVDELQTRLQSIQ